MLYRDRRPLLFFLAPGLVLMLVMLFYPFFVNIYNSFFDIKGLAAPPSAFLGVQNYVTMYHDPVARIALWNSLRMMVLTVLFQCGFALVLALMVDSIRKGQQFFRTVYFFPIVISATAIGLMFTLFYDYQNGMLNQLRAFFGGARVNWLDDKKAFYMISIPVIWQCVGFYFVIFLTGLSGIPDELYEAAEIDGASRMQIVRRITIPLLADVMITCVTLGVTGAIKVFDLPAVIAPNGAPKGLTHFLGTYMHTMAFEANNVDYGSTLSVLIVVVGVVVSVSLNRLLSRNSQALR